MIQKIFRNEYGQIKAKLDKKYYPEPLVLDEKKSSKDFGKASLGFIEGTELTEPIMDGKKKVWDMPSFSFLNDNECPPTVHPNLWRMEQLNNMNGIFRVWPLPIEGDIKSSTIYQVRSYDLATMSIVRSQNGWIIIDPLTGSTTAAYAWEKFKEIMKDDKAKIIAIIITHSHVDHYKGVDALLHAQDDCAIMQAKQSDFEISAKNKRGKTDNETSSDGNNDILVLAPDGFYDESISENLYLGNCMSRRAQYMYGGFLPRSEFGTVGSGLGKTVSDQAGSIPVPSFEIKENIGEDEVKLMIDGLTITFKNVPGTEAPAEMHVYFDDYQALCPGENITQTMHNLLTPRGAKVRDPKAFAEAIDDAINRFPNTNVIIGTHHWPTWNKLKKDGSVEENNCHDLMEKQRDMYLFFNNQVIHLLNSGYNMEEIANNFKLPTSLMNEYFNRGYYGTLNHDAKAVVQRYIGWWDGNPANYFKYTDEEVAKRFVADMGEAENVLKKAYDYFDKQDYRWTVELTRQLVFADPSNKEARELEADALEQLAYSFEAGTWRNIFLSGAFELRGMPEKAEELKKDKEGIVAGIQANLKTLQGIYIPEYLSILIDGYKAADHKVETDCIIGEYTYHFDLSNGVLHYKATHVDSDKDIHQKVAQDSCPVFVTEVEFANYVADYLLGKKVQYASLDTILSCVEIQDTQWNIIEPIDANRQTELNGDNQN